MILIFVSLLFLAIGVWEHGRGLAIALFLILLGLGVWDVQRLEPQFTPSLAQVWESVVALIA